MTPDFDAIARKLIYQDVWGIDVDTSAYLMQDTSDLLLDMWNSAVEACATEAGNWRGATSSTAAIRALKVKP